MESRELRLRSPKDLRRILTTIGKISGSVAFGVVCLIGILTVTPVTLELRADVAGQELDRQGWERIPSAEYSKVAIRNLSRSTLDLPYPELRWPEGFSSRLVFLKGGASINEATERIQLPPGGSAEVRGVYGDIGVTLPGKDPSEVLAAKWQSGEETLSVVLDKEEPGVLFEARSARFMKTVPFLWRGIRPSDYGALEQVEVKVGSEELQLNSGESAAMSTLLRGGLGGVEKGLGLLMVALAISSLMWLLGYLVVGRHDPAWSKGIFLAVGLGVIAIAANTLSYFLPVPLAAGVTIGGIVVFIIARVLALKAEGALSHMIQDGRAFGISLLVALLPTVLMFFPIFYFPELFLGNFKTDLSVDASPAASFLRDFSLLDMQSSPAVQNLAPERFFAPGIGFDWRSIDTVFASMLSLGGQDTNAGFELGAIVLYLVYAVTILQIADFKRRTKGTAVIAALLLLFPPVTTLYLELYWSQYMFAAFAPGLIWAGVNISLDSSRGHVEPGRIFALAILLAAAFLAYPHFGVVVAGGIFLFFLGTQIYEFKSGRSAGARTLSVATGSGRTLITVLLLTLVLIGPGVLLVQGLDDAGQYVEGLNDILHGVLLGPYTVAQEIGLAAGTVPYIWRQTFIDPAPYMGGIGYRVWGVGIGPLQSLVPTGIALVVAVGVITWAAKWARTLARGHFVGISVVLLTLCTVGLVMALGGNSYGAFKLAWTTLCLVPLLVVSISFEVKRTAVVAIALIPLSLLWVRTDVVERVGWLTNPASPNLAAGHAFLQEDLREAELSLKETQPRNVEIVKGRQAIEVTDNYRVLFYQAIRIARDQGIPCQSCFKVIARTKCPVASDAIITIGRVGVARMCGLPRIYRGQNLEVFGRPQGPERLGE